MWPSSYSLQHTDFLFTIMAGQLWIVCFLLSPAENAAKNMSCYTRTMQLVWDVFLSWLENENCVGWQIDVADG